ncbi:hypothetical protein Pmani_035000 [Petrolisthes manimaculis]|uniref:Uncharacterized protein n=1 Tax=Petrolisthes manimaculis TaxID=1843537 RepID=A0AAE1NN91_9EUCA|nr:hypothetical protein Pmani_035000 [Petrolisthes manimaculis]
MCSEGEGKVPDQGGKGRGAKVGGVDGDGDDVRECRQAGKGREGVPRWVVVVMVMMPGKSARQGMERVPRLTPALKPPTHPPTRATSTLPPPPPTLPPPPPTLPPPTLPPPPQTLPSPTLPSPTFTSISPTTTVNTTNSPTKHVAIYSNPLPPQQLPPPPQALPYPYSHSPYPYSHSPCHYSHSPYSHYTLTSHRPYPSPRLWD